MKNNTSMGCFLMLTLVFTAAYMNEYGVDLLQWLLSNSPLYAYTLGLSATSFPRIGAINTVLFTMISLAVGALAAWAVCFALSLCDRVIYLKGLRYRNAHSVISSAASQASGDQK